MENCSGCPHRWHDSDCAYCSAQNNMVLDLTNKSKDTCPIYQREFGNKSSTTASSSGVASQISKPEPTAVNEGDYIIGIIFDIIIVIAFFIALLANGAKLSGGTQILKYILLITPAKKYIRAIFSFIILMFLCGTIKNIVNKTLIENFSRKSVIINNIVYNILNLGIIYYAFERFNTSVWKGKFSSVFQAFSYMTDTNSQKRYLMYVITAFIILSLIRLVKNIISLIKNKN